MHHRPRFTRYRPPWWPENEPWPPLGRRTMNFRRMGCMFIVFNLFSLSVLLAFLLLVGRALGWVEFSKPITAPGNLLLPALGALFVLGLAAGANFVLRRMSAPLDDLLEASGRVAHGDYATPVSERGSKEVRALARAFNSMMARLQAEDTRRRDLLADVSHELRTPLTILKGNIEGLQDGLYSPDEARLDSLLEEIKKLERLVEDLRTLALAESGALALRKEMSDLTVLLKDAAAAFQSSAVSIQTELSGNELQAEVDPFRLREVVDNLLSNAVRHSPTGGVVCLRCRQADGGGIAIEVEDSGPGIAAEDLPHIFERFYKSSDSGGMGLGLAIARHLVQAHGGSIEASSLPGRGALLRVHLPLKEP
jgi:signal transduction histidine kinase